MWIAYEPATPHGLRLRSFYRYFVPSPCALRIASTIYSRHAFREPRGYVHRPLRGNSRPRRTTIANSEFGKLFISAPFLEHTSPCRARGCGRGNVEPISLFVICIIDITSEGGTSDASGLGAKAATVLPFRDTCGSGPANAHSRATANRPARWPTGDMLSRRGD